MDRLVRVMPNCTPETTRCKSPRRTSTILAWELPRATSWRTRESRTAPRENSTAAKKPFRATRTSTPTRRTKNIVVENPPSGIVAALAGKRRDAASRHYAKNKTGVEEEEAMPGAVARCVRVHYTGFSELR